MFDGYTIMKDLTNLPTFATYSWTRRKRIKGKERNEKNYQLIRSEVNYVSSPILIQLLLFGRPGYSLYKTRCLRRESNQILSHLSRLNSQNGWFIILAPLLGMWKLADSEEVNHHSFEETMRIKLYTADLVIYLVRLIYLLSTSFLFDNLLQI